MPEVMSWFGNLDHNPEQVAGLLCGRTIYVVEVGPHNGFTLYFTDGTRATFTGSEDHIDARFFSEHPQP
jgi:hypothetical protein